MTEQRQDHTGLHPAHRALVLETSGIAGVGVYLIALTRLPLAPTCALLAIAAVTAAVTCLVVTRNEHLAAAISGWAITAPGWLAWARITGQPYSERVIAPLVIAVMILTAWAYAAYAGLIQSRDKAAEDAAGRERRAALSKWGNMLALLGAEGVTARSEDTTRAGRVIRLTLPSSGKVTIRHLHALTDGLAAALHLQPSSVWFEQGKHAAEVLMHLEENDALSQVVPFPAESRPLQIARPFPVGIRSDGQACEVCLAQIAAVLVIGVSGSGKTNAFNILIGQLTRMPDVVVFGIDFAGGRLFAPWIRPWIDGRCERPAVDWVATTREEAAVMLDAVLAVSEARDASLIGGSKITPSPEMPHLVVIMDEAPDVLGQNQSRRDTGPSNTQMTEKVERLHRKGRKGAVQMIEGLQRGTVTMAGSGDLKSQAPMRFAMGAVTEADARAAVGDDTAAARLLARLTQPGTGIIWTPGDSRPVPMRWYRLDPAFPEDLARIDQLAQKAGRTRPAPDQLAQNAMGDAYTRRWERSDLYQRIGAESPAAEELARLPHPGKPVPPPVRIPADPARDSEVFRAMMEAENLGGMKPDPRGRMYALLAGRPILGLDVAEICATLRREGLGVDRTTVHRWLRQDIDKGDVERIGSKDDGLGSRYRLIARN